MAKTTLATLKSFIRKNQDKLLMKCNSSFDGMHDCVMPTKEAGFEPVKWRNEDGKPDFTSPTYGIAGAWVVRAGRNWVTRYETETHIVMSCSNCCGDFDVAVEK